MIGAATGMVRRTPTYATGDTSVRTRSRDTMPVCMAAVSVAAISRFKKFYRLLSRVVVTIPSIGRRSKRFRTLAATAIVSAVLNRKQKIRRTLSALATSVPSISRRSLFYRALVVTVSTIPSILEVLRRLTGVILRMSRLRRNTMRSAEEETGELRPADQPRSDTIKRTGRRRT